MALDKLYEQNANRIKKDYYLLPISPKTFAKTYNEETNSKDVT